ncbi:hypothetical protein [Actinomadura sp. 3N407]|uniref:hypothetical protein n=1 Tax=Actinomadura sp. 3N407 TaxID=3457423 RepID=UPI003FCD6191
MNLGKGFNLLMLFNAALTGSAVVLLTVWPEAIPTTVGFPRVRDAYPMGYMLAAAEVGLTIMFFFGRRIVDPQALRLVLVAGAGFHVASALAQFYAVTQDLAGNAVAANILLRIVLAALLLYYAVRRVPAEAMHA